MCIFVQDGQPRACAGNPQLRWRWENDGKSWENDGKWWKNDGKSRNLHELWLPFLSQNLKNDRLRSHQNPWLQSYTANAHPSAPGNLGPFQSDGTQNA
jgi:hypothetical protein